MLRHLLFTSLSVFIFFSTSSNALEAMPAIINFLLSDENIDITPLKKTGQTISYQPKDDGDYQTGVTPSYSKINEVVTDNITGLEWQDDAEAASISKNWADAQTHCNALALDGGGWRLPTRTELISLSDYGRVSPAIDPIFSNIVSSGYWSSTSYAVYSENAWNVTFNNGYQDRYDKSGSNYVRCVRAGQ
ncbi:MAG: DUF1566 domain-containing protein [Sulfurovum sp.]|nr:DUF1566 domain-containing protein [Sulfurovum sp.]